MLMIETMAERRLGLAGRSPAPWRRASGGHRRCRRQELTANAVAPVRQPGSTLHSVARKRPRCCRSAAGQAFEPFGHGSRSTVHAPCRINRRGDKPVEAPAERAMEPLMNDVAGCLSVATERYVPSRPGQGDDRLADRLRGSPPAAGVSGSRAPAPPRASRKDRSEAEALDADLEPPATQR